MPNCYEFEGRDYPALVQEDLSCCSCAQGDVVTIVNDAKRAQAAFHVCKDANWAPSLLHYLGQTGAVEQVDDESIRVRHKDEQRIWWALGAVSAVDRRIRPGKGCTGKDRIARVDASMTYVAENAVQALVNATTEWLVKRIRIYYQALLSSAVSFLVRQCKVPTKDVSEQQRAPTRFMHHERWENALFLHFPVDSASLQALLPAGLEVDQHQGFGWVSLVALTELGISPSFSCLPQALQRLLRLGHHAVNVRTYVKPGGGGPPGIYFFTLDCSGLLPALSAALIFHLPYRLASMQRSSPRLGVPRPQPQGKEVEGEAELEPLHTWSFKSARRGSEASFHARWDTIGTPETEGEVAREAAFFLERYCLYNSAGPLLRSVAMPRGASLWRGSITHAPWPVQRARVRLLHHTLVFAQLGLAPAGNCVAHFSPGVGDIVFFWEACV